MAHKFSSTSQAENTILSLGQVVTINIIIDALNYFLLHAYMRVEQGIYFTENETLPWPALRYHSLSLALTQ